MTEWAAASGAGARTRASLQETVALAEAWKERGLKTIHLEVGDYGTVQVRNRVLKVLGGVISSIGMSHSELCELSVGSRDMIGKAFALAEILNLSRLCVHSDTWTLTITTGDPQRELEALLCGCLLASVDLSRCLPTRSFILCAGRG